MVVALSRESQNGLNRFSQLHFFDEKPGMNFERISQFENPHDDLSKLIIFVVTGVILVNNECVTYGKDSKFKIWKKEQIKPKNKINGDQIESEKVMGFKWICDYEDSYKN